MSLQNAAALLWLLPLAGVIVLLYLLRMRRRDVRVPATFLWPARTDEVRANSLIQRLRFSWLLVLQLLALSLVVFALARPQTQQRGLTGEVTVLVVDTSASMGATDVKPSRFEEAKRLAREAVQSSRPGDRIAVIEAGPTPRVVFPLSNDPARGLRALETLRGTDAEADVGEALRLAAALVGNLDGARIVLLSDGAFEPVRDFSRGKAALVYKSIGETGDNLAIAALGTTETPTGRQIYCGLKNPGGTPIGGTLTIYADGKVLDSLKTPRIAPKGTWGRTVGAPAGARIFEAKLEAPDALKADNYAASLASPGASLRVLLISKGNLFLERALTLDPRVTLDRTAEVPKGEQGDGGGGKYDVVIFDGVPETPVKARGILILGRAGAPSPVVAKGRAKAPRFVSAERARLLQGVDFRNVFVDQAEQVAPKAVGEVLVHSAAGPLVVTAQKGAKRQIYLAFELLQSDFPLQVGFPIFVANALDFLGGEASAKLVAVKAGVPFSVPATGPARMRTPDGETLTLKPTGSTLIVRETKRVGRYRLEAGGTAKAIYTTLRSDRESDIAPVKSLSLGGGQVKATASPARFADFWRPLALLCLLVLAGEWWLYARRS